MDSCEIEVSHRKIGGVGVAIRREVMLVWNECEHADQAQVDVQSSRD